MESPIRVYSEEIKRFATEVLTHAGVPHQDAATEADVLAWANLRGVDSHGVRAIPVYLDRLDAGVMNAKPNIQVVKETPAAVLIDGDCALGPVVTTMAMRLVMKKAREVGIGWGFIRNTTHQGAMGYYPLMAAEEDMGGIAFVCGAASMAPHGARVSGVHNSPVAIAVPGSQRGPLILDMATSVVAWGKISLALEKGVSIPENWTLNENGNPTTDPNEAWTLLPFGGPKGSGMALMFECLSSLMVGNPRLGRPEVGHGVQNSVVAAIRIGAFTDAEAYKERVDDLVDNLKALPKVDGVSEIFVPGELEDRMYRERSRNGIPIPEATYGNLKKVAERFGVEPPRAGPRLVA